MSITDEELAVLRDDAAELSKVAEWLEADYDLVEAPVARRVGAAIPRLLDELSQLREKYRVQFKATSDACNIADDTQERLDRAIESEIGANNEIKRLQEELSQLRAQAAWRPDREAIARAICDSTLWPGAWEQANDVERDNWLHNADAVRALPPPPQNPRKDGE